MRNIGNTLSKSLREQSQLFPVKTWKYRDFEIWPVVCGVIYNSLYADENIDGNQRPNKKSSFGQSFVNFIERLLKIPLRVLLIFCKYLWYFFENKNSTFFFGSSDSIFLSDGISQAVLDNKIREKFYPYISKSKGSEKVLVFNPLCKNLNFPTYEKTYPLTLKMYSFYLKARFYKSNCISEWEKYDDYLCHVERHFGSYYKNRISFERLSQDLEEVWVWSKFWEKVLRRTGAKNAYIVSYFNSMGWGLCLACKNLGVELTAVQYGVWTDKTVPYGGLGKFPKSGYKCFPSRFFLYGDYEKKLFEGLYGKRPVSFLAKGHLWMRFFLNNREIFVRNFSNEINSVDRIMRNGKKNIFIAHQPIEEWSYCYEPLLKVIQFKKDWNFWLKLHPVTGLSNRKGALTKFLDAKFPNLFIELTNKIDPYLLIEKSDVIVTPNSSISIEGKNLGKKTIFLRDGVVSQTFKKDNDFIAIAKSKNELIKFIEQFS